MSFSPISFTAVNYRDYKNNWIKAYEPGTTTPKSMAFDALATTPVIKIEINKDGFPVSSGGALVIPFINGNYDLWMFPTEAEADSNDTSGALRVADNINASGVGSSSAIFVEKKVTLADGQTLVEFTGIDANVSAFYIGSVGVDRGRLIKGVDYTVTTDLSITLTDSYPAGTYCTAVSEEPVASTTSAESIDVVAFGLIGDGVFDNTVIMGEIVALAFNGSLAISWGGAENNFLISGNIPNLHDIVHTGFGNIIKDGNTFHPNPQTVLNETNTIFVSTTGAAGNDGLSVNEAALYSDIRSILTNYGPYLEGFWVIDFSAGTYVSASVFAIRIGPDNDTTQQEQSRDQITNANYVVFKGPDVGYDPSTNPRPVPTAIFDAQNNSAILFDFSGGFRSYVKDIKFINADGSASSGGIICANGGLRCENVHTSDCFYGISGLEACQLEVKGGDLEGDSGGGTLNTGIRSIFHTKHDIGAQGAGAVGQGPFIHNCSVGLFTQEGATGHSDFVTYEDNSFGVRARVSSRVNINGSTFKRNAAAARADTNSVLGWNGNENFNMGGADANTNNIQTLGGGRAIFVGSGGSEFVSYGTDWQTVIKAFDLGVVTGDTNANYPRASEFPKTFFASKATSTYPGKSLRFKVVGSISGTAGTKLLRLVLGEFGGVLNNVVFVTVPAELTGDFIWEGEVNFTEDNEQFNHSKFTSNDSTTNQRSLITNGGSAFDMAIDSRYQLRFGITLSNAADSVTTDAYTVDIQGAI